MLQVDDDLLVRFKDLVEDRIGLNLTPHETELLRKSIMVRMQRLNIAAAVDYLTFLASYSSASQGEWQSLILVTTTGETYFFRDKGHVHLLQHRILPDLIDRNRDLRKLRIWSAGCSTGEEPYSIAILLDLLLPDIANWEISIFATDINEESLKKAELGRYSEWSFRMVNKDIQKRYFSRSSDGWEIRKDLKKMLTLQYGNLMEKDFFSRYPELCNMDLIICRNVFIYFKSEAVAAVFDNFKKILNPESYLMTGHGELLGVNLAGLQQLLSPEGVIYKKTEQRIEATSVKLKREEVRSRECATLPLQPKKRTISSPPPSPKKEVLPFDLKAKIEELLRQRRYDEVFDLTSDFSLGKPFVENIYLKLAEIHANAGDYGRAEMSCRQVIKINPDSAEPYFLLAQISEAKGDDEAAKDLLNKAIYLNPLFIAAYCEMGGLHERHQEMSRARKCRQTAHDLLKTLPPQTRIFPYSISAEELLVSIKGLIKV